MLDPMVAAERWKTLMSMVERVQDPILRECMINNFRNRAKSEWGYSPDGAEVRAEETKPETPAQVAIHEKIKECAEYGVWKHDEEVDKAARANMISYVRAGGKLEDIPAYLRCDAIDRMYRECKDLLHKNLMDEADDLIKRLDAGV
jgi:hypothetical protein